MTTRTAFGPYASLYDPSRADLQKIGIAHPRVDAGSCGGRLNAWWPWQPGRRWWHLLALPKIYRFHVEPKRWHSTRLGATRRPTKPLRLEPCYECSPRPHARNPLDPWRTGHALLGEHRRPCAGTTTGQRASGLRSEPRRHGVLGVRLHEYMDSEREERDL